MHSLLATSLALLVTTALLLPAAAKPSQDHEHRHRKKSHPGRERGWRRERPQADSPAPEHHEAFPADNATLQGYLNSNCSSCLAREEAKLAHIERIKRELLDKLGFARRPRANATQLPDINAGPIQDAISRYGLQSDAPDQPYHIDLRAQDAAKTERVYAFARALPAEMSAESGLGAAYFSFSSDTRDSEVAQADIHVYLRPPSTLPATPRIDVKLSLFLLTSKGTLEELPVKTWKVEMEPRLGVVKVNNSFTAQTKQWFRKPEHNFGLHVRAMYGDENLAIHPNDNVPNKNMYLEMVTREGERSGRSRRNAPPKICREGDNEERCCRYELVVDFEAMGWDWVIAPKKYMAYYCNGGCPFKHLQSYIHTHVVSQYGLPDGSKGPCCYPTELAPIMMVYLNDDMEVLVSNVPSMVANRCGCA